jgi:DNA-binding transcriptional MerR regulator
MSEKAGVTCHTLRFWEKQRIIVPLRVRRPERFTVNHLAIIEEIRDIK